MKNTVCCPVCGREYLPEEIFMRQDMYGNPKSIVRNDLGKIIEYEGKSATLEDTYTCDNCGTYFRAIGKINCISQIAIKPKFEDEYVSKFVRAKLSEE